MIAHPNYVGSSDFDNDIAIVKLEHPVQLENITGYATMAAADSDPVAGTMTITAGW